MAALDDDLLHVFSSFAAFGVDRPHTPAAAAAAAAQAPTLDSVRFAKLCRDAGLLDSQLVTPQAVDIVFARAKGAPRARRMTFAQFRDAVVLLAQLKYGEDAAGPVALAEQIVRAAGPQLGNVHLPQVDETIFSKLTDSRLYTSSHRERFDAAGVGRGREGRDSGGQGKGTVDLYSGGNVSDLSSILRPSFRGATHLSNFARLSASALQASTSPPPGGAADAMRSSGAWGSPGSRRALPPRLSASPTASPEVGASQAQWEQRLEGSATGPSPSSAPGSAAASGSPQRQLPPKVVIESAELEAIFKAYCAFGTTSRLLEELDSARFAKLCRETGLIGNKCTPAAVDVVFAKVKTAAGGGTSRRSIGYSDFCQALALLAPLRHPGVELLSALQQSVELIIACGGPAVSSTSLGGAVGIYAKLTDPALFTGAARNR